MNANVYERLRFLACGGKNSYLHKKGKENKQVRKLQDFLDNYLKNGVGG